MVLTQQQLIDLVIANLPDNSNRLITPAKLRQVIQEVIEALFGSAIGHAQNTDIGTNQHVFTLGNASTTGAHRTLAAEGSDANIDLVLLPKGAGATRIPMLAGAAVAPIEADSQGRVRRGESVNISTTPINGLLFVSPNGAQWAVTVNNTGALIISAVVALNIPTGLVITSMGLWGYRATWNSVIGATSYVVRVRHTLTVADPQAPDFTDFETSGLSFEQSLQPEWATSVSIQVAARNSQATTDFTPLAFFVFAQNF